MGGHNDLVAYCTQDVSQLGIKPATFQCTGVHSNQLSHTVRSGTDNVLYSTEAWARTLRTQRRKQHSPLLPQLAECDQII